MALRTCSKETLQKLSERQWPGNIRELRNAIERMVILSPGTELDVTLLEPGREGAEGEMDDLLGGGGTFQQFKERAEAAFIRRQLDRHRWNISKTAESLDIQRSHLYTKMKRYGLMKEGDEHEADQ